ncbi:hypothetical protein ACR6C2_21895 [Streptomyces sp. INA 01156]
MLTDWPAPERVAVEQAFRALLAVALVDGRPAGDITDLVEGIAHATGDLRPWLDHLAALPVPRRTPAWSVSSSTGRPTFSGDFRFQWWYDGDPRVVATWLPTRRPRIADFAARHPRCKTASDTLVAIDHLDAGDHSPWMYPYGVQEYLGPTALGQPGGRPQENRSAGWSWKARLGRWLGWTTRTRVDPAHGTERTEALQDLDRAGRGA